MINDEIRRNKKLKKLIEKTNINEKDIDKLNYKEKQEYFRAKSKLGKISFVSRDKDGKGITYRKQKGDSNAR